MLIVTGASGKLGRMVVEALMHHVPVERIGVSVRAPAKVADLADRGVRVRRGDYSEPDSLRHAWKDAERILLVSSNAAATGGDPLKQHETAIAVAKEVGVQRLFYTSQISSSPDSQFPPGRDHAATEKMLASAGIAWTSLRHGFYADSMLAMNEKGFESGVLTGPEDGKVAWTTHEDLAAVDALLMAGREIIDGPTPPLTGNEALDLTDLAHLAGKASGRTIERCFVSEETMVENAKRAGVPASAIAVMVGYYRAARAGEFATLDPTLQKLLGRQPVAVRDVFERMFG